MLRARVVARPSTSRCTARCAPRFAQVKSNAFSLSRSPAINHPRLVPARSFAEKPAGKPAGKPGAAPAAASGRPEEVIPPPPPPEAKVPPPDPSNPLHVKHPGLPWTPHGQAPEHVQKIAEAINRLNMIEAMQLNMILQQTLGISEEMLKGWFGSMGGGVVYAAPPGGAGGAGGPVAAPKEEKKEKTAFNLKLVKIEESSKIKILKEIRVLRPGMNLVETKALVEKLPSLLKEGVPKEEADTWVKKLKELGATVELE